jgi:hypothetical protein
VISEAAHMPIMETPAGFNHVALEFLDGLEGWLGGQGVRDRDDRRGLERDGDADEELAHFHVEAACDVLENLGRGVLLAALDLREVGDRHVRPLSDLLEREPPLGPLGSKRLADGQEEVTLMAPRTYLHRLHALDSIFHLAHRATRPQAL